MPKIISLTSSIAQELRNNANKSFLNGCMTLVIAAGLAISSPIAAAALATEALAQAIWSSALAIDAYRDGIN